jgi:RNA polymerase sigma-70 factor, ECF subfamily
MLSGGMVHSGRPLNKVSVPSVDKLREAQDPTTEASILERVLNGHTAAYGEVFSRHREKAFALAFQYLRNREDAKDVVQEAFIKAYRNLRRFDLSRSFGPWLLTIVRNLSIDALRKRKHSGDELPERLPDSRPRPADDDVLRGEVWTALETLSADHREIVFLRDYQGHSYTEIAEILGIPLGTVMSRLHHARRSLIVRLGKSGGHDLRED